MKKIPRVGIGVIVLKDKKVLLGKRKSSHGDGCWGFPGGHLEFNETWEECANREVLEETGIEIEKIRFGTATNDIFEKEEKHYITLFLLSEFKAGVVEIKEPDKCEQWEWFAWENLPEPLFVPIQNLKKQKYSPFEQ